MSELKIWTINALTGVATSDDGEKRLVHGERWITEADAMRLQDEIARLRGPQAEASTNKVE